MNGRARSILLIAALVAIILAAGLPLIRGGTLEQPPPPPLPSEKVGGPAGTPSER